MLLFPIIQLTCFYLAIGKTPKNLELGIFSGEVDSYSECFDDNLRTIYNANNSCHFNKLSCRYIRELGDEIATRKYYATEEAALADAKRIVTVGYIHFAKNFSESVYELMEDGIHAGDGAVDNAELSVHIDMTGMWAWAWVLNPLDVSFYILWQINKWPTLCNASCATSSAAS